MEALFNVLAQHKESLNDYLSLIDEMNKVLKSNNDSIWVNKNIKSIEYLKIDECYDDLKSIISSISVFKSFKSYDNSNIPSSLFGRTTEEFLWTIKILSKIYFRFRLRNENDPDKRIQEIKLSRQLEKIIQESIQE
jgi:hypothetical protein